jgi:hypothetical protein
VALAELSSSREPRLYLSGRYNLALYLVDSGEPGQAEEILEIDASLYKRYQEPWVQLRLTGLRGKIAAARGGFATAEAAFLLAIFRAQNVQWEAVAALVFFQEAAR